MSNTNRAETIQNLERKINNQRRALAASQARLSNMQAENERLREAVAAFFMELQQTNGDVACSCCMQAARVHEKHRALLSKGATDGG